MPGRRQPTAQDYRSLVELSGSLHELVAAGRRHEASAHLIGSLQGLIGTRSFFWSVLDASGRAASAPGPDGAVRSDVGGLDPWQLEMIRKPWFDDGGFAEHPLWDVLKVQTGRVRTHLRSEVVPDAHWDRHPRNQFARALGFHHDMASMGPVGSGREVLIGTARETGDRAYSPRDVQVLQAATGALAWCFRTLAEPPGESAARARAAAFRASLAPRLQVILDALLTGDPEKVLAHRLHMKPRTLHKYVEHVFRAAGVSSRAELMAQFIARPGGGTS